MYRTANSGKTFVLLPLKIVYKIFRNPATGTFAWLPNKQKSDIIHLLMPNNFCQRVIKLYRKMPFIATSDAPIAFTRGSAIDQTNTNMMDIR